MESHFDGAFDGSLLDAETNLTAVGRISDQGHPTGQKQDQLHLVLSPQPSLVDASLFFSQVPVAYDGASHGGSLYSPFRGAVRRDITVAPHRFGRPTPPRDLPLQSNWRRIIDHLGKDLESRKPQLPNGTGSIASHKQAEQASPTRPRLTQEQTAYLEEHFRSQYTPSRSEKDRMAVRLGVSSKKVDNWFQNRRAKERHPPKHARQELGELALRIPDPFEPQADSLMRMDSVHSTNSQIPYPMSQSQVLQSSDGEYGTIPDWAPSTGLDHGHRVDGEVTFQHFMLGPEHSAQNMDLYLPEGHNVQDPDLSSSSSTVVDSPLNNPPDFGVPLGSHGQQETSSQPQAFPDGTQRSQSLAAVQDGMHYIGQVQNCTRSMTLPSNYLFEADHLPHLNTQYQGFSSETSPHESEYQGQAVSSTRSRSQSRRGSFKSDMSHGFENIGSYNARLSMNHQTINSVFKTPDVPMLNLAARRKHKRPPVLSTRTFSASVAQDPSSPQHMAPSLPCGAVRRIKSMGHPLNVISGRVQKASQQNSVGTLRSPISSVPEHRSVSANSPPLATTTAGVVDGTVTEQFANIAPSTDFAPFAIPYSRHQYTQPPASAGILESQTFESLVPSPSSVPPLSAALTMDSYGDQQWARSPPFTPFGHQHDAGYSGLTDLMGAYYERLSTAPQAIPQSAPAHTTEFMLHNSPPHSAHTLTPGARHHVFFPPTVPSQQVLGNNYHHRQFRPQQRSQRLQLQNLRPEQVDSMYYIPQTSTTGIFDIDIALASQLQSQQVQHPRILRAESGADRTASAMEGHFNSFFASPQPPPQKELEIIEAQFPRPKTLPLQLGRNGIPYEFQFQNSGPEDFTPTVNE